MEEHRIGQHIEANKALFERLFWHRIGIINLIHRRAEISPGRAVAWQEIGTGVACRYKGRQLIVTFKHVLEGASLSDVRFLPRVTSRIEWADKRIEPVEGE